VSPYTGLVLELEHLKIETRLISERFANAIFGLIFQKKKKKQEKEKTFFPSSEEAISEFVFW
jgi:hypothetical protein